MTVNGSEFSRRALLLSLAAGAAVYAAPARRPARAHHGWSGYDAAQTLTVTGTIQEASYDYPHGMMRLETPEKTWLVVLAPPSRLRRRGVTEEMLAVGATATAEGYVSRREPEEMRAERITLAGLVFEMR